MTIIPTNQINTVLVTSASDLAKALIYLVTETPQRLNRAIEKIPIIMNAINDPFCPASRKYCSGLSKKEKDDYDITQADIPKLQGIKVMAGRTIT